MIVHDVMIVDDVLHDWYILLEKHKIVPDEILIIMNPIQKIRKV